MYAVVRSYSGAGASELFDVIEQRADDVRDIISGVPGLRQLRGAAQRRWRRDRDGLPGQGRD